MTAVLMKRGELDRDTQEEGHVKMRAEVGPVFYIPETSTVATHELGEAWSTLPPPLRRSQPRQHSDLGLPGSRARR
jgi:hypothetical protein